MLGASLRPRLTTVRCALILAAVGVAAMTAAAPASATVVSLNYDSSGTQLLQLRGHTNEEAAVTVGYDSRSATYQISQIGGVGIAWTNFTVSQPCRQLSAVTGVAIECAAGAIAKIEAVLGDRNDSLTLDPSVAVPALLLGGPGDDTVAGGSGNDEVAGEGGADTLSGGEGNDTLRSDGRTADLSDIAEASLSGGPGDDFLWGTDGRESLDSGPGNDEVRAFGGDDTIDGGEGKDLLNGGDGMDTIRGGAGDDELGTVITGAPGNVSLERGNDTLDGGPGDDLLRPGAGPESPCRTGHAADCSDNDTLRGGDGNDTVRFERRTEPIIVSLDGLANDGQSGEADNIDPSVETLVGGAGSDTLTGTPGDDSIDGAGGDDLIDGLAGNDLLEGGTVDGGSDHIVGGSGDDTLSGSAGDDLLDAREGADSVNGGEGADFIDGGPDGDRLTGGGGADTVNGGTGTDDLEGANGADTLDGGAGDDALRGSADNDVLRGGPGADDMSGGDGGDLADYGLTARVTVTLDDLPNDGAPRELDNVRTDVERVLGGGDQDTFFGSGQANTLDGASGEDYVNGKTGGDDLRGGGARDVIFARDGNRDVVDCGRSVDLAIVDAVDVVDSSCERASDGVGDRPQQGQDIIVEPVEGANQLELPGMERTVPLEDQVEVPVRSAVDASREGGVTVTTDAGEGGRQAGQFEDGRFQVVQQPDESVTDLLLQGGERCSVPGRGRARSAARRRRDRDAYHGRQLRNRTPPRRGYGSSAAAASARAAPVGAGRFRTVGVFSSATGSRPASGADTARRSRKSATGTAEWITRDRCDGTYTHVVSGKVKVRDFNRRRTVTLTAGESYLARPAR